MGDRKFTLIELHLDGETQFGPSTISDALPIGESETDTAIESEPGLDEDEEEAASADEESGGKAIGALVALAVLVGIGIAAKKYTGGDDETVEQEEEPDVIVN